MGKDILQNVWIIQYKDDLDFNKRMKDALDLIYRYGVIYDEFIKAVLTDFKISCGTHKEKMIPDNERKIESYLQIPCYKLLK